MVALTIDNIGLVESIKKLRQAKFTEEQADTVAEIFERQAQAIREQKNDIEKLRSKDLATKKDLQVEIATLRYDTLKFVVWTGVAVVVALGGMLAKGFHWW